MIVSKWRKGSTLELLESSSIRFYLTGSRYFGGFNSTSDWDYFTEDCPEVKKFLYTLGFFEESGDSLQHYDDSTIVTLMVKNDMHIQLVKDVDLKLEAQAMLLANCNMRAVPKAARKTIWNFALNLVRVRNGWPALTY